MTPDEPASPDAPRTLHLAASTHVGRVRTRNEDSIVVGDRTVSGTTDSSTTMRVDAHGLLLVAVADGMGGHPGGDVASRMVVEFLGAAAARMVDERAVDTVLHEADALLAAAGAEHPELHGLGSTVAGVVLHDTRMIVFGVGDSSVWRVLDGPAQSLSESDRRGPSTGISQCLGGRGRAIEPHVRTIDVEHGTRFVVASDGLTDLIGPVDIADAARGALDEAADGLVGRALDAGGHDNISVVVLEA